jgi:arylsulfatase
MWPVHYNGLPVTEENHLKRWKLDCPPLPLIDGNEKVREIITLEDQDMLTSLYTERAVDFIRRNRGNPFFLYLPHTMAHVPLGVSDRFKGSSRQGMYGDVMMEIDWSVGEIIRTLKACGIDRNTMVIFISDNGPWLNYGNHGGSAGGLKEGKGTVFEGGFRVPCIMTWPNVIPAGTLCNQIASSVDILPTIADIAGTGMPGARIDGVSLLSLLTGNSEEVIRNEFFFYTGNSLRAVRRDNWKLVFPHAYNSNEGSNLGKDGWPGTMVRKDYEGGLYNLRRDPGERYDMSSEHPGIVTELEALAAQMREELGDASTGTHGSENRPPGRFEMK